VTASPTGSARSPHTASTPSTTPHGIDALDVSVELRGGTTDRIVTVNDARAFEMGITFSIGGRRFGPQLAHYARQAAEGRLRVRVDRGFPLVDAAGAHELIESGHARGKVLLRP
jgi:NADPH:quinone reductase-like Zn-dependent oxidoreductase